MRLFNPMFIFIFIEKRLSSNLSNYNPLPIGKNLYELPRIIRWTKKIGRFDLLTFYLDLFLLGDKSTNFRTCVHWHFIIIILIDTHLIDNIVLQLCFMGGSYLQIYICFLLISTYRSRMDNTYRVVVGNDNCVFQGKLRCFWRLGISASWTQHF